VITVNIIEQEPSNVGLGLIAASPAEQSGLSFVGWFRTFENCHVPEAQELDEIFPLSGGRKRAEVLEVIRAECRCFYESEQARSDWSGACWDFGASLFRAGICFIAPDRPGGVGSRSRSSDEMYRGDGTNKLLLEAQLRIFSLLGAASSGDWPPQAYRDDLVKAAFHLQNAASSYSLRCRNFYSAHDLKIAFERMIQIVGKPRAGVLFRSLRFALEGAGLPVGKQSLGWYNGIRNTQHRRESELILDGVAQTPEGNLDFLGRKRRRRLDGPFCQAPNSFLANEFLRLGLNTPPLRSDGNLATR
jgi:hypothetical protein